MKADRRAPGQNRPTTGGRTARSCTAENTLRPAGTAAAAAVVRPSDDDAKYQFITRDARTIGVKSTGPRRRI